MSDRAVQWTGEKEFEVSGRPHVRNTPSFAPCSPSRPPPYGRTTAGSKAHRSSKYDTKSPSLPHLCCLLVALLDVLRPASGCPAPSSAPRRRPGTAMLKVNRFFGKCIIYPLFLLCHQTISTLLGCMPHRAHEGNDAFVADVRLR